jgi:hypothetical protein
MLGNGVFADADPGFLDAAKGDLRLKPDAPLFATVGFRPIPLEEIGLYLDDWRASWPARPGNGRSPTWMALDPTSRPARPTATKPAEARPAADDKDRLTKPHTFNTWQPKQRDRDLGKEDDGD